MDFPDERNYEVSQDGTDKIRPGCSVPVNRLLGSLKDWAQIDKTSRWGMLLVNAYTVVRNVYAPGKSQTQIAADFASDMEMFLLYLDAYLTHVTPNGFRLPVVLYFPSYQAIPQTITRQPSPRDQERWAAYQQLASRLSYAGPKLTSEGLRTHRWIVPCGNRTLPAHGLVSWIHSVVQSKMAGSYTIGAPLGIMTHCAVDLHMHKRVSNFKLWEYFTSAIKTPDQFGTKLQVPSDIPIPFTVLTHRLFGDAIHIKAEVTGRMKTKVLETAKDKSWMRSTDHQIFHMAGTVDKLLKFNELTSYKF